MVRVFIVILVSFIVILVSFIVIYISNQMQLKSALEKVDECMSVFQTKSQELAVYKIPIMGFGRYQRVSKMTINRIHIRF